MLIHNVVNELSVDTPIILHCHCQRLRWLYHTTLAVESSPGDIGCLDLVVGIIYRLQHKLLNDLTMVHCSALCIV